ncbi:hypothetical protein M011DRAFT_480942 [Sporormia fimetaria CBS 119925]|uniref:Fascin domain-containing protein n=1 Tax=Sporormia fimetaria CBS 119925 TaxID=1340428 RepID=A0A6A6V224_9PLEO|nr:hypothetical protein M011DRAFT_480942 [Sporormia fimetaria CBS 119925]
MAPYAFSQPNMPKKPKSNSTQDNTVFTDCGIETPATSATEPRGSNSYATASKSFTVLSDVPWPSATYVISVQSKGQERVLALLEGEVVLKPASSRYSIHWEVVQSEGWCGLRNTSSGKYLGYSTRQGGLLVCTAERLRAWEQIEFRHRRSGGYLFIMSSGWWGTKGPVREVTLEGAGTVMLLMDGIMETPDDGAVFRFTKV